MPDAPLFSAMFSFVGVVYGLVVPLIIVQLLAVVIICSMMVKEAKPKEVAQAVYCYLMMALGVLLMSAGALPTIISVLAGVKLTGATYFTLLIIFAAGGLLFLWHDALVRDVPSTSRMVSETLFIFLFKIAGHLLVFLWSLSLIVTVLNGLPFEQGWWIMPIVMIAYGSLFIWCTRSEDAPQAKTVWDRLAVQPTIPNPGAAMKAWSPVATTTVKAAPAKAAKPKKKKSAKVAVKKVVAAKKKR